MNVDLIRCVCLFLKWNECWLDPILVCCHLSLLYIQAVSGPLLKFCCELASIRYHRCCTWPKKIILGEIFLSEILVMNGLLFLLVIVIVKIMVRTLLLLVTVLCPPISTMKHRSFQPWCIRSSNLVQELSNIACRSWDVGKSFAAIGISNDCVEVSWKYKNYKNMQGF